MKNLFLLLCVLFSFLGLHNGVLANEQIVWSYRIINATTLEIKNNVADGYFVYDSISKIPEVAPISFSFSGNPPLHEFKKELSLTKQHDAIFNHGLIQVLHQTNRFVFHFKHAILDSALSCKISYTLFNSTNFLPQDTTLKINKETDLKALNLRITNFNLGSPLVTKSAKEVAIDSDNSWWQLFLFSFLGGLIALLTPCVFPMLPLTISFFSRSSQSNKEALNNAFFYTFSIISIYGLLSLPFHLVSNISPDFLNNIATNAYVNLFFFVVMIVFGISFLGVFEIQLPSRFVNFSGTKSSHTKKTGVFFMALTLCIVSFSCTGPILGTLLANTLNNSNGATSLSIALIGFGAGLGLPFGLLSMFPRVLKSLPKSGNWMTELKIFLAVIEFALALKFLSNADLVLHWGLLKREFFLAAWAILLLVYFLYLVQFVPFLRQQKISLSIFKIAFASLILSGCIYFFIGTTKFGYHKLSWYNKLSNGILPPYFYSIYNPKNECILGLTCVKNYSEAVTLSAQTGKLILLDFTGWACVNCRKMEENVWSHPAIQKLLQEHFIIASLYVDDRTPLKTPLAIDIQNEKKNIETIGDQWTYFQILNFNNNSQPLYAILNANQQLVNTPIAYTPNISTYETWLKEAINWHFSQQP